MPLWVHLFTQLNSVHKLSSLLWTTHTYSLYCVNIRPNYLPLYNFMMQCAVKLCIGFYFVSSYSCIPLQHHTCKRPYSLQLIVSDESYHSKFYSFGQHLTLQQFQHKFKSNTCQLKAIPTFFKQICISTLLYGVTSFHTKH